MHPKHTCSTLQSINFWVVPQSPCMLNRTRPPFLFTPLSNTYALYLLQWWILTHLSSYKPECHPALLPLPFPTTFGWSNIWRNKSLLLWSDWTWSYHLHCTCLCAGLLQFSAGFLHLSETNFPIFIPTALPNSNSFFHCVEGDIYKMQSNCVNPPCEILSQPSVLTEWNPSVMYKALDGQELLSFYFIPCLTKVDASPQSSAHSLCSLSMYRLFSDSGSYWLFWSPLPSTLSRTQMCLSLWEAILIFLYSSPTLGKVSHWCAPPISLSFCLSCVSGFAEDRVVSLGQGQVCRTGTGLQ